MHTLSHQRSHLVPTDRLGGRTRGYDRVVTSASPSAPRSLDEAFAAGTADLRTVYDEHSSLVYSLCRRALGAEAAKDATQEVFVSAWRKREQFDPAKGALGAWIVGITKRRIVDQLRAEGRHADRRADEVADDRSPSDDPPPDRVVDRMFAAHLLAALPSRTREVIELVYVHDLTHREVAEQTGLPIGTVKSDIRRGIMRIRDEMRNEVTVSHV